MSERILQKLIISLKREGVWASLKRIVRYLSPRSIERRSRYREMLETSDIETRFEQIFLHNLWGDIESASGAGSSLESTKNLREELPRLFANFNIETVLDIPCGDFHWMQHVMKESPDIEYIGGDIVPQIIESNIRNYGCGNLRFFIVDLRTDDLPDADIIIVRDCLFHLSFLDVERVIENIQRSNIKFLLTTSHIVENGFVNRDIKTGDFRLINIFREPFSFVGKVLKRIPDYSGADAPREMCLFEVSGLRSR